MSQHQALNRRPTTNYGSTDTRLDFKNAEHDDEHYTEPPKVGIQLNEVRSMNDFCQWLTTDTFSKINAIFFFISILVPFIMAFYYFGMKEDETTYLIAGIYGICASLYGLNHFRTLFNLKNEIDSYTNLNDNFRNERILLNKDIKTLKKGTKELKNTQNHLRVSNLKMIDMIRQFDALEGQLDALNIQNNQKLTQLGNRADKLRNKYYDISLTQQRTLLWKLFDRLEKKGLIKDGIDEDDYKDFYELLPKEYKDRFDRLGGFKGLLEASGTNREYIDAKNFERALSMYAKMHVENTDIVFKLAPIKDIPTANDGRASTKRGVTTISFEKRDGFYLSKEAVWAAAQEQETEEKLSKSATPEQDVEPVFGRQRPLNG